LIGRDPRNPHYLEMLAETESKLGNFDQALELLEEIETIDSGYPPPEVVHERAAETLLALGDLHRAQAEFRESQAIRETAAGQYRLAKIAQSIGDTSSELEYLQHAVALDGGFVPARLDLGIRLALAGDTKAAGEHFRSALEANPYDARTAYNYGTFLIGQEKLEESLPYFARALELHPHYVGALYALAETNHRLGNAERAAEWVRRIEQVAPASREAFLAASLLEEPTGDAS
jgi:tetratricopeptide (TPR) repeat protein